MRSLVRILGYILFAVGAFNVVRVLQDGEWEQRTNFAYSMIGLAVVGLLLSWFAGRIGRIYEDDDYDDDNSSWRRSRRRDRRNRSSGSSSRSTRRSTRSRPRRSTRSRPSRSSGRSRPRKSR